MNKAFFFFFGGGGGVENIVGIGENAGYQHFLLYSQGFQRFSIPRVIKRQDCVVKS